MATPGFKPNRGYCPEEAKGKRVGLILANGQEVTAPGWPADGKFGCRWTLTGDAHDIREYRVL